MLKRAVIAGLLGAAPLSLSAFIEYMRELAFSQEQISQRMQQGARA
ncbi:hypothetical protein EI42_05834 [Thermosporothrix hazakensis]|uniref:Uncharacterized protein n=1 Tax=Thermosporothrix hazakensis TaxID=644383 RepID=A0A326TWX4_THEHA|nr:hypothetical protein [Thermosporothrix hazakensis]PZW20759.1 hypothetical protein EI42_05834 [Thermosporothrix hazakensis]